MTHVLVHDYHLDESTVILGAAGVILIFPFFDENPQNNPLFICITNTAGLLGNTVNMVNKQRFVCDRISRMACTIYN